MMQNLIEDPEIPQPVLTVEAIRSHVFDGIIKAPSRNLIFYGPDDEKNAVPLDICQRPGMNATGKEIEVMLNAYPISKFPSKTVYQYDVHIGNGAEKRAVIQKVWNSNARKSALRQTVFDGNKLAWSIHNFENGLNVVVDLDAEQGRRVTGKNQFRLVVRRTKTVNLAVLSSWLHGQASFSEDVNEALTFLDHVLREYPSGRFVSHKRSFIDPKGQKEDLGNGVLAFKGVYQAIRITHPGRLCVNVDVSNTCYWARISVMGAIIGMTDSRDIQQVMWNLKPIPDGYGGFTESAMFYEVHKRLNKLVVRPHYANCPVTGQDFVIKGLVNSSPRQFTIDIKDKATGNTRRLTVMDYFKERYNIDLRYPDLPMVEMTKKEVYYPMEFLTIEGLNKYPYKLSEYQTAKMIKFAVSRPAERLKSIEKCKETLSHGDDPVLASFGMKVENNMIKTKARLLPNPEVQFGNQKLNPGTAGRWDLRGKKFLQPNKWPLTAWGVGYVSNHRHPINQTQVETFCDSFMKIYSGHGGKVANRPCIVELKEDVAEAVKKVYTATGNKFQKDPQLIIFIVPDKNTFTYLRIKKSMDCRWGCPSQVLQSEQLLKGNPQYVSNVLMKVNAKLGGTTARAISKTPDCGVRSGSLIIGADVSHSSPGSWAPSMAAVSVCADPYGARYWGACETNMERVEMITHSNLHTMLKPLIREWMMTVNKGRLPDHVYYFRDGVSDGQYQQVLMDEVPHIKALLGLIAEGTWNGKFTVVICSKRHHIRAFPRPNDRNAADKFGNPLPGTLIERDITSPDHWDFILYSHIALQGTSRPVHYHVILDELKHKPHQLQNMIYDHCYQYLRSTTSVSLFPAVYYAHLISNRARHHENVPASSGPQSGPHIKLNNPKPKKPQQLEKKLLPIHASSNRLAFGMWYI
ncbi:Protein argonaute [Paecilomyces lecythidis]